MATKETKGKLVCVFSINCSTQSVKHHMFMLFYQMYNLFISFLSFVDMHVINYKRYI